MEGRQISFSFLQGNKLTALMLFTKDIMIIHYMDAKVKEEFQRFLVEYLFDL
jgi:hypothetical protein